MNYAEVAVHAPVNRTFHYHIPPELADQIAAGHLVRVSFGTADRPGVVMALLESSPVEQTKPILERIDPDPVMGPVYLQLAQWMSQRYLSPLADCLWLMLPPGISGRQTRQFRLMQASAMRTDPVQQDIIDALAESGPQTIAQLRVTTGEETEDAAAALISAGIIRDEAALMESDLQPKTVTLAQLAVVGDALEAAIARLRGAKQKRILHYLSQHEAVPISEVCAATKAVRADLEKLAGYGLLHLNEVEVWRNSLLDKDFVPQTAPQLTDEQAAVWRVIEQSVSQPSTAKPFLLHGVTGSGKTEIYLRAIEATLARGRGAIFLVPEIALTPQTVRRVLERFPDRAAIVHGSLSPGERYDTWRQARDGGIDVIVGTRSALFTPLPDLGLIILDEEHDHSYKQSPPIPAPHYHAREVAEQIATLNDALVILGSATPEIETYYRAQKGHLTYLHLPERIMGHRRRLQEQSTREGVTPRYQALDAEAMTIELPPVELVDMRQELRTGNTSMFSRALADALADVLQRGEQAMLLLNRRGQATYVFCRDCGYVAACPRCDTPMTYHRIGEVMRCHHCNHTMQPPDTCPVCKSWRIKYFGAGTQQVEDEIRVRFPGARLLRWDADTAHNADQHEAILQQFMDHEADLMIGTQMIAKGLDLPLVTLVGVISADPGLALPDFRSGERAFQLLTQVAGRAGRGLLGGRVILQTYQPDHYAIAAATGHDYAQFYEQEIAYRRDLGYPPFRRLVRLLIRNRHPVKAQQEAEQAAGAIARRLAVSDMTGTTIMGPAPCFFRKLDDVYRWHVLVRGPDPVEIFRDMELRPGWMLDIDPVDVL